MEQNKQGLPLVWIIGGIVIVVAIIVGIYFSVQKSTDGNKNTANVDLADQLDTSGKSNTSVEKVSVTSTPKGLDVVNLQTFPYKVQAQIKSELPDSCSIVSAEVTQEGKVFTITTTASRPKDAMCAQVVTSNTTTVNLPVTGLAAGTYTVKYATFSKTFTLVQKNQVDYSSDK